MSVLNFIELHDPKIIFNTAIKPGSEEDWAAEESPTSSSGKTKVLSRDELRADWGLAVNVEMTYKIDPL